MTSRKTIIATTVLALGVASAAFAGTRGNDAVTDLAQANITLAQAVGAAEQHAGGRATKAELERREGKAAFEVEVVNGQAVSNVVVDATDGRILASTADREDREDRDGEHEDE